MDRRPGRPTVDDPRTEDIGVTFTKDEKALIKTYAYSNNKSMSDFIRDYMLMVLSLLEVSAITVAPEMVTDEDRRQVMEAFHTSVEIATGEGAQ